MFGIGSRPSFAKSFFGSVKNAISKETSTPKKQAQLYGSSGESNSSSDSFLSHKDSSQNGSAFSMARRDPSEDGKPKPLARRNAIKRSSNNSLGGRTDASTGVSLRQGANKTFGAQNLQATGGPTPITARMLQTLSPLERLAQSVNAQRLSAGQAAAPSAAAAQNSKPSEVDVDEWAKYG